MKKLLIAIVLGFLFHCSFGQDKIELKDGRVLNVKIIEQSGKYIKYKMTDYVDSPELTIRANWIEKIEYQNGQIDLMGNQNPRRRKPFGINTGIAFFREAEGATLSASIDYFIIPQICIEINAGTKAEAASFFAAGSKFHLNSNYSSNKLTPYTGVLFGTDEGYGFIQIPVGVNCLFNSGFNVSLSLSQLFYTDSYQDTLFELKLGWKFKM